VKADDVVREQPLVHGDPHLRRERVPVIRLGPRDVDEMRRHDLGLRLPHQTRGEIEVVVVEENGRVGLAFEFFERRCGQAFVHWHVALAPGRMQLRPEVRRGPQPPEVVLQEPESRVRQQVVKAVVCSRIVCDEPQPIRGSVRRLLDGRAVLLRRYRPVLLGHRARDPRHVVMGEQASQRGDDAAAAPPCHATSLGVTRVRNRRAVEDDEELPPGRCRC
jgi:hypothetical protein